MSAFEQSIRSFMTEASSASPTPGGGSVAALAASLGASMGAMVASLSQGVKYKEVEPDMVDVEKRMREAIRQSEALLEADMRSFERYMSALKLPKETAGQQEARREAMEHEARQATEVPLRLMRLCRDALRELGRIAETANKNVISDLGIGAILLESAAHSALLTVEMNVAGMNEAAVKQAYQQEANRVMAEIAGMKNEVIERVRRRMGL